MHEISTELKPLSYYVFSLLLVGFNGNITYGRYMFIVSMYFPHDLYPKMFQWKKCTHGIGQKTKIKKCMYADLSPNTFCLQTLLPLTQRCMQSLSL